MTNGILQTIQLAVSQFSILHPPSQFELIFRRRYTDTI